MARQKFFVEPWLHVGDDSRKGLVRERRGDTEQPENKGANMHRRYDRNHIPIELLRTLVAIEAEGSFTKAGTVLGLTQSAISAQVRRFEQLVGGDVFVKSGGGLSLTPLGASIAQYARRILQINDQILSRPGAQSSERLVRIGISTTLASVLLLPMHHKCRASDKVHQVQFRCDDSVALSKAIEGGYLDIAVLFLSQGQTLEVLDEWLEPLVWACSPNLLVSPNERIPYISWLNNPVDDIAVAALERAGRHYLVSFASPDFNARMIAAEGGLGYTLLPERAVTGGLKIARESFLPKLPPVRIGVAVGPDFNRHAARDLVRAAIEVTRPEEPFRLVVDRTVDAPIPVARSPQLAQWR